MSSMKFDPTTLIVLAAAGAAVFYFTKKKTTARTAVPATYNRVASGGNPYNAPTTPNWANGIVQGITGYLQGASATPVPALPVSADAIPVNPSTTYLQANLNDAGDAINGFV